MPTPSPHSRKTSLGCLAAFLAPFFASGLIALVAGISMVRKGETKDGLFAAGFGILFITLAGAFLAFGIRSHRRNEAQRQFEFDHPNFPWLWRPEWRNGRIQSSEGMPAKLFWFMAIVFIGISLPAMLAIPKELKKGNNPILIALIFPLAGIGMGVAAARSTLRARKFGRTEFELRTLPAALGGTLSGALEIPAKVRTQTGFELRLVCLRRTTSGSGKNRSTTERVLWEEQKTILKDFLEHEPDKTGLPVFFNIPFGQPESLDGNPAILWRLEVTADVPGVDYAAQFELPVFMTEESRADVPAVEDPTLGFQPPPKDWAPPANSRIRVVQTLRGDTEIHFPASRNLGVILGLLVFLAIWTGTIWFMIEKNAPLFFPIVFGLFDLLLIVIVLQMLIHSVRVIAGQSEIQILHRLLILSWRNAVPVTDIESIKLKSGMQSGTNVYYDLRLTTRQGRKYSLGRRIPDKKHARWLLSRISDATGVAL